MCGCLAPLVASGRLRWIPAEETHCRSQLLVFVRVVPAPDCPTRYQLYHKCIGVSKDAEGNGIHDSYPIGVLYGAAEGILLQWEGESFCASSVVCLETYWTGKTLHCGRRCSGSARVSAVCVRPAHSLCLSTEL